LEQFIIISKGMTKTIELNEMKKVITTKNKKKKKILQNLFHDSESICMEGSYLWWT